MRLIADGAALIIIRLDRVDDSVARSGSRMDVVVDTCEADRCWRLERRGEARQVGRHRLRVVRLRPGHPQRRQSRMKRCGIACVSGVPSSTATALRG